GTVDAGEECDDGNTAGGDGCSMTCQEEMPIVCGDGDKEGTEECDDGNVMSGDGCAADCTSENAMVCGDGTVDPGEQCDDGNQIPLDGCENDCTVSPTEMVCATLPPSTNVCDVALGNASKLISGDILGPSTIYRGGQVLLDANGVIA